MRVRASRANSDGRGHRRGLDDALVPASHSRVFAEACQRANVPVAFTLFPHGETPDGQPTPYFRM